MKSIIWFLIIVAIWFVMNKWILPKLGIST